MYVFIKIAEREKLGKAIFKEITTENLLALLKDKISDSESKMIPK